MADEAGETNTAVDGSGANEPEPEVLEVATDSKADSDEEGQKDKPVAESTWSTPILSLARKATETISSGVSYGAALRNASSGFTASSPTKTNSENDHTSSCTSAEKLPGKLDQCWLLLILNSLAVSTH